METLLQLEEKGVFNLRELEALKTQLQSVTGVSTIYSTVFSILDMWIQGCASASLRPTWRHFLWALREIKLNHLADRLETFLSEMTGEQAVIPGMGEDHKQEVQQGEIASTTADITVASTM